MTLELRVLSFNIRTSTGRDGLHRWRRRRDAVSRVVRGCDIGGLQEARWDQLVDLGLGAPGHRWFGRGRADGRRAGEFVPVVWRADRFVAVDQGVFWHSATPAVPGSRDHDRAISRLATWTRLGHRRDGRELFVVNTHFDHRVPDARLAAARQIRAEVDDRAGDDPVVVVGDLNERPGSPAHAVLTAPEGRVQLIDTRAAAGERVGPESSLHGFGSVRPDALIDHVLCSPQWIVDRSTVVEGMIDGRFPSDHCPVVVDLRLG